MIEEKKEHLSTNFERRPTLKGNGWCLGGSTLTLEPTLVNQYIDENLPFYCWDKDYNLRAKNLGKYFGVCIDAQATSLLNMTYIDAGELPEKVNNYWSNESSKKEHEYFQKKYVT